MRGLQRFVEKLLKGGRPRPFPVDDADADVLRVAIELRAARPGADDPGEDFVADLHRRLAEARTEPRPTATRRRLLLGGAVAATGAVAGAATDHALTSGPARQGTVTPDAGIWHPVAATADLTDGTPHAFDTGAVTGFVARTDGRLRAVSGVCTHQGCRLHIEAGTRLRCPCHGALFALDGAVLKHRLPNPITALPRLAVRESDGMVQVYVPRD